MYEEKMDKMSKQMWMSADDSECESMVLAHAYVPWQMYHTAFSPQEALSKGTLFPELYGVYMIPQ